MPPDNRQLTIRVRTIGAPIPEKRPHRVRYHLEVLGARGGEEVGLTLAFYDGASMDGEAHPGAYQVVDFGLGRAPGVFLDMYLTLPTEWSGWAVREARAGGWAWPFTVDSGDAPGATSAGAPVPQAETSLSGDAPGGPPAGLPGGNQA